MKIEIYLSEYWFPVLLAFFKAIRWAPAIQWWRAVTKRHYSYKNAAKRTVADAAISIDLFWLANLIAEPVEAIVFWAKHFAHVLKVQSIWVCNIFTLPWELAYLTVFAWILRYYIYLMDVLNGSIYADILAQITPGGLWEAYWAYLDEDYKQALNNKAGSWQEVEDDCKGPGEFIEDGPYPDLNNDDECQCPGCVSNRSLMQAMTIIESGSDHIDWANRIVEADVAGTLDTQCIKDQGGAKPGYTYVPLDHVLSNLINKGVLEVAPGGTSPTIARNMSEMEKVLCKAINEELGFTLVSNLE